MLVKGSQLLNTLSIKNKRSGVIIYTFFEGRLYFLLAVDRRTREYTDFGGGCKNSENLLQGAWREFQEESCGIFKMFDEKCLETSIAVTNFDRNSAIFFVEAPAALLDIAPPLFKYAVNKVDPQILKNKKNMENIAVEWIIDEDFQNLAFGTSPLMWNRLQKFFKKNFKYDDLKLKIALQRAISIPDRNILPRSCPEYSTKYLVTTVKSLG